MKNICFIDYDFSVIGGVEKVLQNLSIDLKPFVKTKFIFCRMSN